MFDRAIVGWGQRPGDPCPVLAYSWGSLVGAAMAAWDLSLSQAREHVTSHCSGAWMGPGTPLILHPADPETLQELAA